MLVIVCMNVTSLHVVCCIAGRRPADRRATSMACHCALAPPPPAAHVDRSAQSFACSPCRPGGVSRPPRADQLTQPTEVVCAVTQMKWKCASPPSKITFVRCQGLFTNRHHTVRAAVNAIWFNRATFVFGGKMPTTGRSCTNATTTE